VNDLTAPGIFSRYPAAVCSLAVFLLLVALGGCLSSEPRVLFRPEPAGFAALAQDIAKVRTLPFKRNIVLAPDFVETRSAKDLTAPFDLSDVEQAYKSTALLPRDSNLAELLGEFRRLDHLFDYDSSQAAVAIAPDAAKLGARLQMIDPTLAREAPLGFAIVGALQEQNFQWQEKLRSIFLEDQRLALRALATGDAVVTLVARSVNRTDLTSADLARVWRFAGDLEKSAARLPAFLRDQIAFCYRGGSRFVLWALKTRGWAGVDALYARPPVSTAALLHPEKYFVLGEQPLRFYPAALLSRVADGTLVEQSFGEQLIRSLLAGSTDPSGVDEIAAEWRGDQLFTFRDSTETVTAWYSAWTSAHHALRFHNAYKIILERGLRLRLRNVSEPSKPTAMTGRTPDNRGVWLTAQGPVVLLLSGGSTERLRDRVDHAWRDLEVEADSRDIRFDSVGLERRGRY
jgi:hypothetical protein